MICGTVIGIARRSDRTLVHIARCAHYPRHGDELCPDPVTDRVYLIEQTVSGRNIEIELGDFIWTQLGYCYWSTDGVYDVKLPMVG